MTVHSFRLYLMLITCATFLWSGCDNGARKPVGLAPAETFDPLGTDTGSNSDANDSGPGGRIEIPTSSDNSGQPQDGTVTPDETPVVINDSPPLVCGYGSVLGRVCSPSGDLWLAGATVEVNTTDCDGNPLHLETTTDVDGFFTLDDVPNGVQVILITKGSFHTTRQINVITGQQVNAAGPDTKLCVGAQSASIAVVTGRWDHVEQLLDETGVNYTTYTGVSASEWSTFLSDLPAMESYDIIMLNCGIDYEAFRTGNAGQWATIIANIQTFVDDGGSLYASDYSFQFVEEAFPTYIDYWGSDDTDYTTVRAGIVPQSIDATIIDPELNAVLNGNLIVEFPSPAATAWAMFESVAAAAKVIIEGPVEVCNIFFITCLESDTRTMPLTATFEHGHGKVVYSSFHLETSLVGGYIDALKWMIFQL